MNKKISLCQNSYNSCGACCGLLQVKGDDFRPLRKILRERTQALSLMTENFTIFDRQLLHNWKQSQETKEELLDKWQTEIYLCPFLGYLSRVRIGCLLHPLYLEKKSDISIKATEKIQDFRDLSFYGNSICEHYDCPSKDNLSDQEKLFIAGLYRDPLIYSAIVADYFALRLLLDFAKNIMGSKLWKELTENFNGNAKIKNACRHWFALIVRWPWRQPTRGYTMCSFDTHYCDYSLRRNLQNSENKVTENFFQDRIYDFCNSIVVPVAKMEELLEGLRSRFTSKEELENALNYLKKLLWNFRN